MADSSAHPVNGKPESAAALNGDAEASAVPEGAVNSLQDEILALGPEAAELHQKLAALFSSWLADEKKAAAELERQRKQYEADNVRLLIALWHVPAFLSDIRTGPSESPLMWF